MAVLNSKAVKVDPGPHVCRIYGKISVLSTDGKLFTMNFILINILTGGTAVIQLPAGLGRQL